MSYEQDCKNAEELEPYASAEGSECGEYWSHLINLVPYVSYMPSEEFKEAFTKELQYQLDECKKNYVFEKTQETRVVEYTELVWVGE